MKKAVFSKVVLTAIVLAALVWAAVPANAQTSCDRATIPFAFTAGPTTVPAGEYWVTLNPDTGVLRFRAVKSVDTYSLLILASTEKRNSVNADEGLLRFQKAGDQYFLRAVFSSGKDLGNQVRLPKALLEAARTRLGSTTTTLDLTLK